MRTIRRLQPGRALRDRQVAHLDTQLSCCWTWNAEIGRFVRGRKRTIVLSAAGEIPEDALDKLMALFLRAKQGASQ